MTVVSVNSAKHLYYRNISISTQSIKWRYGRFETKKNWERKKRRKPKIQKRYNCKIKISHSKMKWISFFILNGNGKRKIKINNDSLCLLFHKLTHHSHIQLFSSHYFCKNFWNIFYFILIYLHFIFIFFFQQLQLKSDNEQILIAIWSSLMTHNTHLSHMIIMMIISITIVIMITNDGDIVRCKSVNVQMKIVHYHFSDVIKLTMEIIGNCGKKKIFSV